MAFCRKNGLAEGVDVQEWMLDLVWMDKKGAIGLAVESELQSSKKGLIDDFLKLMVIKAPLKLFIYKSKNALNTLTPYLKDFPQHLEGEEYLLMDVGKGHADFYHYKVPNSGSVSDVVFTPLQFGLGSSA